MKMLDIAAGQVSEGVVRPPDKTLKIPIKILGENGFSELRWVCESTPSVRVNPCPAKNRLVEGKQDRLGRLVSCSLSRQQLG